MDSPDSKMSASNSHLSKAPCKSSGWRPTEHVCSVQVCELRAAKKLKFTKDMIEGGKAVCSNSEGQTKSTHADTHFLSLHFSTALANSVRWLSVFSHTLFSFPVQMHLLRLLPLLKTCVAISLSLCRRITSRGN